MGTVYKGYQNSVDRFVAIKVLPPHPGLDDEFRQRFQLEARTIGGLQHPHILPLYDYGSQDDILYLVMAYVEGGTLDDSIKSGAMDPQRVETILRQIAGAMDYAHRRGVVHRDIKPANILLDTEGNALLADFGIVKMLSENSALTGTGVVGTPAYMAPEQSQGMPVDGRVDIYALGVMVFEMLTGEQPFTSDNPMQLLIKHISDPVPNILDTNPDLSGGLAPVMQKVLAKDPDERYQTATDFAEAFSRGLHNHGESLAAARAAAPLKEEVTQIDGTRAAMPAMTEAHMPGAATPTTGSQTIIMRESSNPLVLLAGFGLIALVIVIVSIVLITSQNNNSAVPVADATNTPAQVAAPVNTPVPADPGFGEVRFTSVDNPGDAVQIQVNDLAQPESGKQYVAWLKNSDTDETLMLGEIIVDAFGEGAQVFTPELEESMLPAQFNMVALTQEERGTEEPTGAILYEGSVPIEVTNALMQIFIASEDGLNGGSLLNGAQVEADTGSNHAGLAARANSVGSMRTHAEHTLNILNGTQEDYDGDGRAQNPGRGVGVYFFLDRIDLLLEEAVNAPDAGVNMQINAELIRICTLNTRDRADRVQELEQELLAAEDIADVEPQSAEATDVAGQLRAGFDLNENGQIEPFEGECGLDQITEYGVQFGNITLFEAEADDE